MSVTFKEILPDKSIKERNHVACFYPIYGCDVYGDKQTFAPDSIEYFCNVRYSISKKDMLFYLSFLEKICPKDTFTYTIAEAKLTDKKNSYIVNFILNTKGLARHVSLFYLTAFRYLDEMDGIVTEFGKVSPYAEKEELFSEFQKIHFNRKGNLSGHHVMYSQLFHNQGYKFIPITLEEFYSNLNNKNIKTVFNLMFKYVDSAAKKVDNGEKKV